MKKLLFILSVSVFLFSCSTPPERGNYIPKSAQGVVTINMKGIVEEIKWDILFGEDLFEFKSFAKENFVKQLMADPVKSGVDFMDRSYVFYDSSAVVVVMVPLSDAETFTTFLTSKGDTVQTIDDFQCSNSFGSRLVWNDKTAFLVSGQKEFKQAIAYVSNLIDGKKTGLLSTEFKGKAVLTGNDHIAYWVNWGAIQKTLAANPMLQSTSFKAEKSEITGVVNFKNGKLEAYSDQYFEENSSVLKILQKEGKLKDLSLAADVNKAMISLGLSINMQALVNYLGENNMKETYDALLSFYGVNTTLIGSMLEGDVFVSFDGVKMKMEQKETVEINEASGEYEIGSEMKPSYYPSVVAGLTLSDTAMMKQMVNRMLYNFAAINKQGIYSFGPGKGFLFFKDKNLFYVSDSASISNIMNGKSIASNEILNDVSSAVVINIKDISQKTPLADLFGPSADADIKKVEASIEGLKAVIQPVKDNVVHSTFELNAVNKEENILISILKLIKELDSESPEA